MSDAYDLRLLGPAPYDRTPRLRHTPEETRRLVDGCREDDRRADESEWLRGQNLAWSDLTPEQMERGTARLASAVGYRYEEDEYPGDGFATVLETLSPPPFAESAFLRGLLWGIGLTASAMLVAAVVFLGPMLPR